MTMEKPEGTCCLDHALCDVDVPGEVGERARDSYRWLLSNNGARWCHRAEAPPWPRSSR